MSTMPALVPARQRSSPKQKSKVQIPNTGTSSTAGGTMRISSVVSETVSRPMKRNRTIA